MYWLYIIGVEVNGPGQEGGMSMYSLELRVCMASGLSNAKGRGNAGRGQRQASQLTNS